MPDYGPFSDLVPGDTAVQDAPKNYGVFSDLVPKQGVSAFAPPSSEVKKDYGPFTDLVPASVTPATDKALAATSGKPFVQAENSIARAASQGPVPGYDPPTGGDDLSKPIVPASLVEPVLRGSAAAMTGGLSEVALANVPGAKGVLKGASELYSGTTTPQNAAMLAVAPEGKLAQGLIGGIFLGQQLWADPEQWKALQAAKTFDEQISIGTQMLGGHVLPALAIAHAGLSKGAPKPEPVTLSRPVEQNTVQTATEPLQGQPNAIQNQETATIHGDVLNSQRESQIAGEVPTTQGSQGISDFGLAGQEQRVPITTEEAIAEINRRNAPNDPFAQYRPTESGVINEETPKIDVTQTQERGIQGRQVSPETQTVDLTEQSVTGSAVEPVTGASEPAISDEPYISSIANRFTQERSARGEMGEVAPGQGFSASDLAQRGLRMPPEEINQHVSDIIQGGGDPVLQAAAIRGEEARLSQRSNQLSRMAEANPKNIEAKLEADNAFKDLTDFHNGPVARLKENWANQGRAMQGEIPVDLSTFNGLREQWLRDTGQEPPSSIEPTLRRTANKVAESVVEENGARSRLAQEIDKTAVRRKLPTADEVRNRIREELGLGPCR